jgi:hypothetical protein
MIVRAATDVPPSLAPEVSGTVSTVVNLGFVVGVAALGSLYLNAGHGTARASGQAFSQATVPMAALALCSAALAAPRRRRRRAAATSIGAPADVTVAESLAADGRASTVSREHRRAQRQLIEADALLDRAT